MRFVVQSLVFFIVSHTGIVLIHFVSLSQDKGGLKELQGIFKRLDDKDESTEVCLLFLFLMEVQGVHLDAQPLTLILPVWYRTIINQYNEAHRALTSSSKSTKAPTIKSTKAPTIKSTKAPTIKSTKAPTIKSTKAPTIKSNSRRDLSLADSMEDELEDEVAEEE
jgi:hypothetical protein